MSSITGEKLKINVFGQSHGAAVGAVAEGLPAGFEVDFDRLNDFLGRRAPGNIEGTTKRKEKDRPVFMSGIDGNILTGQPLSFYIENRSHRSEDYDEILSVPRPSHADLVAKIKYGGFADMRGGGNFSGRLTAPAAVVGGIAKQVLESRGIKIIAHIRKIGDVEDSELDCMKYQPVYDTCYKEDSYPVFDENIKMEVKRIIQETAKKGDSIGAVIQCGIYNVPEGAGEPLFDSVESTLSKGIFSIPGVKGIEFGKGFDVYNQFGSAHNDQMYYDDEKNIRYRSNNSSGIIGGISNGMPIIFNVAVKPTPSIFKEQESINLETGENVKLRIKGRHDPCIALRAVPVVEAVAAFEILDLLMMAGIW